jgi:hypothetical protein
VKIKKWSKEEIKNEFPDSLLVGGLIRNIEDKFKESMVVCEVKLNEMVLSENDEQRFAGEPISLIENLEVKLSPVHQLLNESLNSLVEYVQKVNDYSIACSDLFREEDLTEAHNRFQEIINGATWITDMMGHLRNIKTRAEAELNDWNALTKDLLSVVREILSAYEKKDFVMVADLMEYEWTTALDSTANFLKSHDRKEPIVRKPQAKDVQSPMG